MATRSDGLWAFDVPLPHAADPQQWHSFHNILGIMYGNLANLLRKQNREKDAMVWDQKMRTVRIEPIKRQEREVAQNVNRRTSLLFLGVNATGQARLLRNQKATMEAREYYRKAIDAYRTLAADFPSNRNFGRAANEAALELASVLVDDPEH